MLQNKILKPHFERTCFTLVQEVDDLQKNRDAVWQSHISDGEQATGRGCNRTAEY